MNRIEKYSGNKAKSVGDTERESWWGPKNRKKKKKKKKHFRAAPRDDWLHMLSCHSMSCYERMEWVKNREEEGGSGWGGREGGIKAKGCRGGEEERRKEWRRKVRGGMIWKTRNVRRSNKRKTKESCYKRKKEESQGWGERRRRVKRPARPKKRQESNHIKPRWENNHSRNTQPIWHEKHKIKSNESPQTESWLFTPSVFSLRLLDGELQGPAHRPDWVKQDLHPRTQSWESRPDARAQLKPAVLLLSLHAQPINSYNHERQWERKAVV